MMRRDTAIIPAATTIAAFRGRFPLGATSRVVLIDDGGGYVGIVVPALAYAEGVALAAPIATLAPPQDLTFNRRRYREGHGDL